MPSLLVWFFLFLATIFAAVHRLAMIASLYWYYPWFDIVMHFWGGVLVALGMISLSTLKVARYQPNLKNILLVLFTAMISWEVFERAIGLYSSDTYLFDTTKDMVMGLLGGLSGYFIFRKHK